MHGVVASSSSPDEQSVGGDEDSLAGASAEESLVAEDEAATALSDGVPSKMSDRGNRGSSASDADSFTVAPSENESLTGDADDVLPSAASEERVVSGDGDGVLLTPTSPVGSLVAGDTSDILGAAAPPPEGVLLVNDRSEDAEKASPEGRGVLAEDCASEESFTGDRDDSTDTASLGARRMDDAVAPSTAAVITKKPIVRRSAPLRPAAASAVAETSGSSKAGAVAKIEKEAGKDRRGGEAQGRVASAWLGGEKWNTAASAGPSLPRPFRTLRVWTNPPEGWECGPEGRWVPKKPPTTPPTTRSCRHHPPPVPKNARLGDERWGSGRRPLA